MSTVFRSDHSKHTPKGVSSRRTHLYDKTQVKVKNEQTYSRASLGKIYEVVEPRVVLIVKFWYFDAMAANQVV
jgi:hypothetical protein